MIPIVVVARDTLHGFLHQKLAVAIVLVAFVGTGLLLRFAQNKQATVRHMQEMDQESTEAGDENGQDAKASPKPNTAVMDQAKEQVDTFMQAAFFIFASGCGVLLSLGLFSTLLAMPLRRGELRGILARPITRWQYVVGRTAGGIGALMMYWVIMSIAFAVFSRLEGGRLPPVTRYATILYLSKGIMIGCIGMALSLYVRPLIAAIIALAASSDWVSQAGVLYKLLPGDDRLSVASQLLRGSVLELRNVLLALFYAMDIAVIAIMVTWLRFRKADIA